MPISLPSGVFNKAYDLIDSTWSIFGQTCTLVYVEKVEETTGNNHPNNQSVNVNRRGAGSFSHDNKVYREVEKTENINMKVYWNRRDWVKVGGNLVVPDDTIQTLFFTYDLHKVNRAKQLIVHTDVQDLQAEQRFTKLGQPIPFGLRQERYFACFWERS